MLREIDKQLIKEEASQFGFGQELTPINFSPFQILNHYDVHEFTEHWYDSQDKECNTCEKCVYPDYCKGCKKWEEWDHSINQLRFNNWVDVWAAGIWNWTQKQVNVLVRNIFEGKIYKDGAWRERLFYYRPNDSDYIYLFYYNRDREYSDYWFIFKRRKKNAST